MTWAGRRATADWRLLRRTIFISWWGQGITGSSFLWLIGWGGGLPPHFGQKKIRKPFLISCSVMPLVGGGYSVLKASVRAVRLFFFRHNKVSKKNPLSFYFLSFYNFISSFLKKRFCSNSFSSISPDKSIPQIWKPRSIKGIRNRPLPHKGSKIFFPFSA